MRHAIAVMPIDGRLQQRQGLLRSQPIFWQSVAIVLVIGWCFTGGFGSFVEASDELPLPPGAVSFGTTQDIRIGAQPYTSQGFSTDKTISDLNAFYRTALPKHGWRVTSSPVFEKAKQEMQNVQGSPQLASDSPLRTELSTKLGGLEKAMERTLYAQRGNERLMLSFSPGGDGQTVVSSYRWRATSPMTAQSPDPKELLDIVPHAPSEMPGESLITNPCCGGGEVATQFRRFPSSIPRYPNGRMIANMGMPSSHADIQPMAEMYLTEDSATQVADFYRKNMVYNGWSNMDRAEQLDAKQLASFESMSGLPGSRERMMQDMRRVMFVKGHAQCTVIATEMDQHAVQSAFMGMGTGAMEGAQTTPLSASMQPGVMQPQGKERTMILVNYMENPMLMPMRSHAISGNR